MHTVAFNYCCKVVWRKALSLFSEFLGGTIVVNVFPFYLLHCRISFMTFSFADKRNNWIETFFSQKEAKSFSRYCFTVFATSVQLQNRSKVYLKRLAWIDASFQLAHNTTYFLLSFSLSLFTSKTSFETNVIMLFENFFTVE